MASQTMRQGPFNGSTISEPRIKGTCAAGARGRGIPLNAERAAGRTLRGPSARAMRGHPALRAPQDAPRKDRLGAQDAERPARGRSPLRAFTALAARGAHRAHKKSALRERDALPSRSLALQYSRRRRA